MTPNNNSNNYAGQTVYGKYTDGNGDTYYGKIRVENTSSTSLTVTPSTNSYIVNSNYTATVSYNGSGTLTTSTTGQVTVTSISST